MNRSELTRRLDRAHCRVYGWQDATSDGHRETLAAFVDAFDNSESAILVEPSLSRKSTRPPDIVLIDPEVGVHVVEVKAVALPQLETIEPGGVLVIRYAQGIRRRNAIAQVRSAMFDIKDATARAFERDLTIPFRYWVVFPRIHRTEWTSRFGRDGFCPPEFLFADDLDRASLLRRLHATDRLRDRTTPIKTCRLEELQCVWTAFGDNSVLYVRPEQRPERKVDEGTLGDLFDQRAQALKRLSPEQQRLSEMFWESGPRLIRGVAGSGKTVVLANNLARRVKRMLGEQAGSLFGVGGRRPRVAAVCFNRTLAPFISSKVATAFEQRTGRALPEGLVHVFPLNKLVYELSHAGVWAYQPPKSADETTRARRYREQLLRFRESNPSGYQRIAFDAIYVDEGQDFVEAEFELLRDLCLTSPGGEPNLYVFYDDAQNLYGRGRPNWASLGLNIRGRAYVMTECYRNPRPIVETSFNVLYGTAVEGKRDTPSRDFGDIATLQEKKLITMENGRWRVLFARRKGHPPMLTLASDRERETRLLLARLALLIRDERVRPQDILVLTLSRDRAQEIADAIRRERIAGVSGVHLAFKEKDATLCPPGKVTVSTVHSAKGYDAFIVLLAGANDFRTDVTGRACFYVASTRAVERLEIFASERSGLVLELARLLEESGSRAG